MGNIIIFYIGSILQKFYEEKITVEKTYFIEGLINNIDYNTELLKTEPVEKIIVGKSPNVKNGKYFKSFVCFKGEDNLWDLNLSEMHDLTEESLEPVLPRIVFGEEVGGIGVGLLVPGKYSQKYTQTTKAAIMMNIIKSLSLLKQYGWKGKISYIDINLDSSDPTKVIISLSEEV